MHNDQFRKTFAGRKAKDLINLPRTAEKNIPDNQPYVAPVTDTETALLGIWAAVLHKEGIGIQHDFFRIGGNSLKATQLISRIIQHFGVEIKLVEVFKHTTITQQSSLIDNREKVGAADIPRLPQQEDYALSHAQQRLLFIHEFSEGNATYVIPMAGRLKGKIDRHVLRRTFEQLLTRNEILRTAFRETDGSFRQVVLPVPEISRIMQEYQAEAGEVDGKPLAAFMEAFIRQPFDLAAGYPVRVALVRITEEEHLLLLVLHHLVCDGTSVEILMKETAQLYNAFSAGQPGSLPELPLQYRDFAAWQQEQLSSANIGPHRYFWLEQLGGELPVLQLPADLVRPPVKRYQGAARTTAISPEIKQILEDAGYRAGASFFMVLQATLKTLFYRYTGQEDIILGTVTTGRDHVDLENQVGMYVNTLALRTRFSGKDTFDALLEQVKINTLEAFEHRIYPFDYLVGELQPKRDMSRSPLFDVMLVLHNNRTAAAEDLAFNGLQFESYPMPGTFSKFDLTFNFRESDGQLLLTVEYDTALFTPGYIDRMVMHWQTLVSALEQHHTASLHQLTYLPDTEIKQVLHDFNATACAFDTTATVADLLEQQVARTPHATALTVGAKSFTYSDLHAAANRLARYLRLTGISERERIGILLDRSEWMLIAMLGAIKAGAVYVPLDSSFPAERLAYITTNSCISCILTGKQELALHPALPVTAICVEDISNTIEPTPPLLTLTGDDSMYVLYTSGSTGLPKGVEIPHRAVVNFLLSMQQHPGISAQDVMLAVTTYAFDISVLELLLPLISGASIILATTAERHDPALLETLMQRSTIMQATPITWRMLTDNGWKGMLSLKILCGGEALSMALANSLLGKCASLYNVYGPTETTVWSAVKQVTTTDTTITVGKPIANTRLYVLDADLHPAGIMVYGELYIAGEGLAKGYLFQPALTEEKFIPDPYFPGQRMYRSGDIARWRPDGELEIAGRADQQLKVRGFRIEPGEVEAALLKCAGVQQAIVTTADIGGEQILIAYITGDIQMEYPELADQLRKTLPEYMIPSFIIPLAALPLTPNGKIDRKALPPLQEVVVAAPAAGAAPRNERETRIAAIWKEVLGVPETGIHDNFFQSGGHSLKATQVISRIHQQLGIRLRLPDLFMHPTIAGISALLDGNNDVTAWEIVPATPQESWPLSNAQRRLWIIQQWEQALGAYHMSNVYRLRGTLDLKILAQAFQELLNRHESLRTAFRVTDGEPQQVISAAAEMSLQYVNLQGTGTTEEDLREKVTEQITAAFDLQEAPLIRVSVLQLQEKEYIFVLTMHHIISDGWSMEVMVREVLTIYEALRKDMPGPLLPLSIHYKDYTMWQQQLLSGSAAQIHRDYWMQRFSGNVPVLELPLDHPRPAVKTYRGATLRYTIEAPLVKKLETIGHQQNATLFMTLLAAVNTLLYRYTGQDDIIIGSPVAGRDHAALENQIGFYVNTLALRTRFSGEDTFLQLLQHTRQTALEAYAHQVYPFDQLVDDLNQERTLNRNPLFDVMVVLQNTHLDNQRLPKLEELEISPYTVENPVSKFDWWFSFSKKGEALTAIIEYDTALFTASSMERLIQHFTSLLQQISEDATKPLIRYRYLTAAEEQQLLTAFNDTTHPFREEATIVSLFEETVQQHPDHTALVADQTIYTYQELNEQVNRLAHYLRRQYHLQPDDVVGLLLERSPQMVIAMLAVLKAGAAYVPIDPAYPAGRIAYIVQDSGLKVLLTDDIIPTELPCEKLPLNTAATDIQTCSPQNPGHLHTPDNLMYIIYTSGSTGLPKGCMLQHRSVINRIEWMWTHYGFTTDDRILQKTAYVFDVSVWEFFMTLCFGARLILCKKEAVYAPEALATLINREGVTTLHFVPSMFETFLTARPQITGPLKRIFTSGEALPLESVRSHYQQLPQVALHNLYGPTEAAVDVTFFETTPDIDKVLIGRPIWNTEVYILDSHGGLVPPGVYGEIYLGGEGLARGYRNKPELTAQKFVPHPFHLHKKLYRTGDVGRFMPDGSMEYAGRNDDQLKIRGYRVEPGEVSAAILTYPAVSQAIVTAADDQHLAAYVVCKPGALEMLEDPAVLQSEQVNEWTTIFNHTYTEDSVVEDPFFNIKGWNSSYTGTPIPATEMKLWVDDVVELVLQHQPQHVLEIGCGTGLLLFRIAPFTQKYTGTEISAAAIEHLTSTISTVPGKYEQVTLHQLAGDQLSAFPDAAFDTIIINSVIQYFPDTAYLTAVIADALRLLQPGGRLIIGDVRSLPLSTVFHTSVAFYRAEKNISVPVFREQVKQALENEKELLLDPAFFIALEDQFSSISEVQILPKTGDYENELTRFRYQVVISTGDVTPVPEMEWTGINTITALEEFIATHKPLQLGIPQVSNNRLDREVALTEMINNADDTLISLEQQLDDRKPAGVDYKTLLQLPALYDYELYTGWGRQQSGRYDVILTRKDYNAPLSAAGHYYRLLRQHKQASLQIPVASNPLREKLNDKLVPGLKSHLLAALPEYMVPAYFILMDQFPLTINGKLDRKALPLPVMTRAASDAAFQPPRTETERLMAAIWMQVLKVDRIGVFDNFFTLGGHSLKATQVISRLHQQAGIKLELRMLFSHPTIAELARVMDGSEKEQYESIMPAPAQSSYPLSFSQRRLWVLQQWEQAATAYNMLAAYDLRGTVDKSALQQAFAWLVQRHESLRTRFVTIAGQPRQVIMPFADNVFQLQCMDDNHDVRMIIDATNNQVFDLEKGPLIRLILLRQSPEQHILLLHMHHIISDGWSMQVLIKELMDFYFSRSNTLSPLRIQYKDYTLWQQQQLSGGRENNHRAYWMERFKDSIAVLDMPADFTRPPVKTYKGKNLFYMLDAATAEGLQQLSEQSGASLFMTLIALVNTLIYRYSGAEDIVIGSPVAGRHHPDLEDQIGFYVNTLALRHRFSGTASFDELLAQIKKDTLDAFDHQHYPFDRLVDDLTLTRDTSRSPLFDVMVILQNTGDEKEEDLPADDQLRVLPYNTGGSRASKTDLAFYFMPTPRGLGISLEFNTDLFLPERIQRMLGHFAGICRAVLHNTHTPLYLLDYLGDAERKRLLHDLNGPVLEYPTGSTLPQLLHAQAARTPDATALVTDEETLTYAMLHTRANRLAHYILEHHAVKPGSYIGIMTGRTSWMITAMLAVLKTGAAYVPIDPAYPDMRIRYMLEDTGAVLLLTGHGIQPPEGLSENVQVLSPDKVPDALLARYPQQHPLQHTTAIHPAYCIYTSGSTGTPKGIQLSHRNAVAFITWARREFAADDFNTVFAGTSYCFDLSIFEIFYTLCTGKYIRLLASGADIPAYLDKEEKILLNTVPSVIRGMLAANVNLDRVAVINIAGEPVPLNFREQLDYHRIAVRNLYGPSEDTTYSSCYRFSPEHKNVPIGKPVANTQFYILDKQLQLLPEGIAGEICISGDKLSAGYLHQPALNADRFITHPFRENDRLYRTGDLGRWLPDGNMEYLGRMDFQVKVRGFRIELGEIETAIARFPGVINNVVVADGNQQLIAYIQPEVPVTALITFLESCLPAFMVPAIVVTMEQLPLNSNGKIDRPHLPDPVRPEPTGNETVVQPRNETESTLVNVWQQVLGRKQISIHDNYFDLGGDSIRGIQIVAALHKEGLVGRVGDIFQYPTIARLAEKVRLSGRKADQSAVTGPVLMTPIQQEWLTNMTPSLRHHYNQAVLLHAPDDLDADTLGVLFEKIMQHHDALRMVLSADNQLDTRPQMPIRPETFTTDGPAQLAQQVEILQAGIDLQNGPLVKPGLFQLPEGKRLLIVMHHLVMDGVSWRILFEDLRLLYEQNRRGEPLQLPLKTDAFKQWSERLTAYAQMPAALAETGWWQATAQHEPLPLPGRMTALPQHMKDNARVAFQLGKEDTELLLTRVNNAFNTTINDILLTALSLAVYRTGGNVSTAITLEGHGREDILPEVDISRTIGWFTSSYPVVLQLDPVATLPRQIKDIKESLRQIPNKGIGYGILKYLGAGIPGDTLITPISFNYLGQFDQDVAEGPFRIAPEPAGTLQAPESNRFHEWEVNGLIINGVLSLGITFSRLQFDAGVMSTVTDHYKAALTEIITLCAGRETTDLTPSDFTYKKLSIETIDNLFD